MTTATIAEVRWPDPGSPIHQVWNLVADHANALTVLLALIAAGLVVRQCARRTIRQRWHDGSRAISLLPSAGLTGSAAIMGGQRFWRDLMGTAPPWWRRIIASTPHLTVEYWLAAIPDAATENGVELTMRIWIPAPIAPGRVENAIRTAWPGTLIVHEHADQPTASAFPSRGTVTGGLVRPERGEHLPLHAMEGREDSDPLRALESLANAMSAGELAVVQILARPAVGRRLRRYRAAVNRLHTGRPAHASALTALITGTVRELLDVLTPGASARNHSTASHPTLQSNPQRTEELRAVREKAAHPQWEAGLRYAVAASGNGPEARGRIRGLADSVFAVFAVLAGRNALARHHLPRPAAAITARRMRRGALLSAPELAALAHLPARTAELSGRRARAIPAPRPVTGRLLGVQTGLVPRSQEET